MTMAILEQIAEHYQLDHAEWKEENKVISTNLGDKQVRFWAEEQLLNWHIEWRDEVALGMNVATDRMLRTANQNPWIASGTAYITLHDHVTTTVPCAGYEENWGQLIGGLLQTGIKLHDKYKEIAVKNDYSFKKCLERLRKYKEEGASFESVKKCLLEADKRQKRALELTETFRGIPLPLLDRLDGRKGKEIFNLFFYEGGTARPELGYRSLRIFLIKWLNNSSPYSLKKLLTCINKHFSLESEHGFLLLAEILAPIELYECLDRLQESELSEMMTILRNFEQDWERNRVLLHYYTDWLDEKRRKVAL